LLKQGAGRQAGSKIYKRRTEGVEWAVKMYVKTKRILKSRQNGCVLQQETAYRTSATRPRTSPGPKNKL